MAARRRRLRGGMGRRRAETWTRFVNRIANAFGLVLLLVIGTYVLGSLTRYTGWSAVGLSVLASAGGVVALATAEARLVTVRIAAALAAAAVALAVVAQVSGHPRILAISALIQVLLLSVAAGAVLRAVLGEEEVGFRTILGAVSVYVIF